MPLTTERPGLFRGRAGSRRAQWFVIDPEREADPLREEWAREFALGREPWWKVAIRWVAAVSVFVVVIGIASIAATLVTDLGSPFRYPGMSLGIVGGILALVLAPIVWGTVFRARPVVRSRIPGVVAVEPWVAESSPDGIPDADLWELARQADRTRQARAAREHWDGGWDEELGPRPSELIADTIGPVLDEALAREEAALAEVAARVGVEPLGGFEPLGGRGSPER